MRNDCYCHQVSKLVTNKWSLTINKKKLEPRRENGTLGVLQGCWQRGNHRFTSHPSRRNNYEIAPLILDVMQTGACLRGKTTREAGRSGPKKTEERLA